MNEAVKTCVFLAAAAVAIGSAYLFESKATTVDVRELVGRTLNPDIDLDAPRRLQIIKFDRETASVRQFEVAEVDDVWCIPSKDNYPADATQQMAEAVTCLMDRKVLRIAGDTAQSHEEYGVVDPQAGQLNSKSAGVGTRVIMTDKDDKALVDMIIGEAVKDNPKQRYVRLSNQDVVYVVDFDPTKLSTSFADWIEKDLMKLKAMDLRKTYINDYSADLSVSMTAQGLQPTIKLTPRAEITLAHGEESAPWEIADLKKFDPQKRMDRATRGMVADALAADEEVNQDAVKGLVTGLDDLLIVDVARKPAGLSADLKAGEAFLTKNEAVSDLVRKGFIPGSQDSGADMLSSEGELICTERNGVEYVLRFGQLKVQSEGGEAEDGAKEKKADADATSTAAEGEKAGEAVKDDKEDAGKNLRRYLFVMARFNEDAIEKPKYKELPEVPAATEGAAADQSVEKKDDKPADAAAEGGAKADDAAAKADEAAAEKKEGEGDKKADGERAAAEAKRKEVERENERLKSEYDRLVEAGKKEVSDLNNRFGDWYFVISNDVYKKIHLGRGDVIKKKEATAADGKPGESPAGGIPGVPNIGGAFAPPADGK